MHTNFAVGEVVYQKTKYGKVKGKIIKIVNENFVIVDKGFGEQKVRVDQLIKETIEETMSAKEQEILSRLQQEFLRI